MPIKKFCTAIVSVLLLCSLFVHSGAILSVSAISVSADSAILIDGKSGSVIYSKNAEQKRPMASTTKIMTAVVAIEDGDLDRTVKIPDAAIGIEGSSIYLCKGEELTLRQLLYALMLASANDAATAIAIAVGGSVEGFAHLMNQKASDLGLSDTHFDNPHGLDSDTHYTTAKDLAALAAYAMAIPEFREIVSQYKKEIPMADNDQGRLVVNHNKLLRGYDGAIGIKTGFTKKSGRCLVSAAERDGALLIAVTLSAPDDWNDHRTMLDYGFENYVSTPLTGCETEFDIPVISGTAESVLCGVANESTYLLPRDHGSIVCRIECDRFLYAPVEKGEVIGKAIYFCDGVKLTEVELIAREGVSLAPQKYSFWNKIKNLFGL